MNGTVNKKRIIFALLLICAGLLFLTVFLIHIYKPPYMPIKHTFDRETGVVTFKLDPKYSIDQIYLSEGYYPQPIFDGETTEVSFRAFDLASGQHEFVYFICRKRAGKAEQIGVEFEILHQSDSEILIQVFENGRDYPGYRKMYTYSY